MSCRWKYKAVDHGTLVLMDRALRTVGGSFVAAAKLVDMEPDRFRNLVNYHACLKIKWGHTRRGRPSASLGFRIEPHDEGRTRALRRLANGVKSLLAALPRGERQEIADWLQTF